MESQPLNPEFRNNPENFTHAIGGGGNIILVNLSWRWKYGSVLNERLI